MRAMLIARYGGPDVLYLGDRPDPQPGSGQVRLRVVGAAVGPTDVKVRSGQLTDWVPATFPWVLGWDTAGTVDAVGDEVTGWQVGDHVVAMWDQHFVPAGSYAQYLVLDAGLLAAAPETVELTRAAALPLAAVTAAQALELLDLPTGSRLLIPGAAGIVGGLATQLAVQRGLHVTGTARSESAADTARQLGAEQVLAADEPVPARAFDAVLHAAGPTTVIDAVRDGGGYLSILPGGAPPTQRGITPTVHYVTADADQLTKMSRLVDKGGLTLRVADVLPLTKAAQAHRRLEVGALPGRLVLTPS